MNGAPEVTAQMLARGFEDVYARLQEGGSVVYQDTTLPTSARRALARLSRLCMEADAADLGSSIHLALAMAAKPMGDWGVPQLQTPFRYADLILIDDDLGVPTADCRELARLGGSEVAAEEELHHEQLRAALQSYPSGRRAAAYSEIREFVVRHPLVSAAHLQKFIIDNNHVATAQTLMNFYRPVPSSALFSGSVNVCDGCGGILWPDSGAA